MVRRLDESHYFSFIKEKYLFAFILPFLGYQDFFCQGVFLSELQENYSSGPPMLSPPYYDDLGEMIEEPIFGPPPVNLTRYHVKCRRGNIHKLLEIGLSTPGSRCPSSSMDDLIR